MNKRVFLVLFSFAMLFGCAFASTVTRSADNTTVAPGADLKVTLAVNVTSSETFYIIDEKIPSGWAIKDAGTGATEQTGHLKWVIIQGAKDTDYEYVITPPSEVGTATFAGTYMFEGMEKEAQIQGVSGVQVITEQNTTTVETNISYPLLAVAAIVVIIVAFVIMSKRTTKKK